MGQTNKLRLGTASPGTQATTAATLAQIDQIAHRATQKKIDILLLPEAYIGGYPRGTAFGCLMGSRSSEGRDEYLQYFHSAVDLGDTVGDGGAGAGDAWVNRDLPGDHYSNAAAAATGRTAIKNRRGDGTREELERIARQTGVFLVTGCIEKAGGSLYCAAVYVCPKLGMIGKRRKVMPTGIERLVWAQGSPATLRAVSTVIRGVRVNLAAAICWENYMPLVRQSLYAQNVNLYLAPTADNRDAWLSLMRTVAVEGRCFVVSSNMCVPKTTAAQQQQQQQEVVVVAADARRRSLVTGEGFEIVLPTPPARGGGGGSASHPKKRRESVFDEDGNEIVLCCKSVEPTGAESGGEVAEEADEEDAPRPQRACERPALEPEGETEQRPRRACERPALEAGEAVDGSEERPPRAGERFAAAAAELPPNGGGVAATAAGPREFVSRGGSSIISPFGDVLAGPQWEDEEGLVYADVDFEDCIRGRLDLDAAGSYSRNDSFKFSVTGLDLTPLPY